MLLKMECIGCGRHQNLIGTPLMTPQSHNNYSPQFRDKAIAMVTELGKTRAQVSKELKRVPDHNQPLGLPRYRQRRHRLRQPQQTPHHRCQHRHPRGTSTPQPRAGVGVGIVDRLCCSRSRIRCRVFLRSWGLSIRGLRGNVVVFGEVCSCFCRGRVRHQCIIV